MILEKGEMKATHTVTDPMIVYALKHGKRVTVIQRNMQNAGESVVLSYDESVSADKSGNLWEGLPPSVTLSPDQKHMAYIDSQGLKVINIETDTVRTYITTVGKSKCDDCASTWSVQFAYATYGLAQPQFSGDGEYISFLQAYYEGSAFGLINTSSGSYIPVQGAAGSYNSLHWSPVGQQYIVAETEGGYVTTGLFVSSEGNIGKARNIVPALEKPGSSTPFYGARFSPDGQKIVFIYELLGSKHVGMANPDGTGLTMIAENIEDQMPFFSRDGSSVYFLQRKNDELVLVRHALANKQKSDMVIMPVEYQRWQDEEWIKDGYLAIKGVFDEKGQTIYFGGDKTRLLVLDVENKQVIYASEPFEQFTTFLGFL